jgi:surfactin synthase thioesterase subunit
LFCFPHAGGATAVYHRWANEFPAEIDVIPILLPGRERRHAEPALRSVTELSARLAEDLAPHLTQPFAFFGHSMGALVAFELARVLRGSFAESPAHVFVAAFRAPQTGAKSPPLYNLPDDEFVAAIQERFGGIPSQIAESPEFRELFLPALRADVTAVETYNYHSEPPLECPITALAGVEDRQATAANMAGWRSQTVGEFSQKMFPGGHFFVVEQSADVARIVRDRLERSLRGGRL